MQEYIFGERNGIYIIDLQQTLRLFKEAVEFISELAASGKTVLFVGTKRQAQEVIEEEALRSGMYFVTNRWLGGLLTNFSTIQKSIKRYKELDRMSADGFYEKLSKKEAARLERERKKLEKNLRGIREMDRLPGAMFVIDTDREEIAVKEAKRLNIPVVAVVDTNCDPELIDYVIPGNDDALRAVKLFASTMAEAILAGRSAYDARVEKEARLAKEKAAQEAAVRRAEAKAREAAKAEAEARAAAEAKAKAAVEAQAKAAGNTKAAVEAEPVAAVEAKASVKTAKKAIPKKKPPAKGPKATSNAPAKAAPRKKESAQAEALEVEATTSSKGAKKV